MSARITLTADDTDWSLLPDVPGLLLDVPHEGRWRQRPSLHVQAAPDGRLRLTSGGQPLLWLRIDWGWRWCCFLRGTAPTPWRLPPITAAQARVTPHAPSTVDWWGGWAHHFARELERAEASVLHAGRWCLRPLLPVPVDKAVRYPSVPTRGLGDIPDPPHSLEDALRFGPFWAEDWDYGEPETRSGALLALRAPSAESDGRVKAWRKHARDGTLPPVLLLYFHLAGKWLVVDGHDRLHAALLEGLAPPLLGLWPVVEEALPEEAHTREAALRSAETILRAQATPGMVDSTNDLLVRTHQTHRRATATRAWWLAGGAPAWHREVLARREQSDFPADADDWEWFTHPQ